MASAKDNKCVDEDGQRILVVGLVCLDIVNVLEIYPLEDSENELNGVHDQMWARGGNAGNTSIVLSQLGVKTEYMGTLAQHTISKLIEEDLQRYGVAMDHCVYHDNVKPPVSCVIVNSSSGTRTILHGNRTLPELKYEDFQLLNLDEYKWIHFEGRNAEGVLKMIAFVDRYNAQLDQSKQPIKISVEIEKPKWKGYLNDLVSKADLVFLSKDVSMEYGCKSGEECVLKFHKHVKQGAVLVCAWGDLGAWAIDVNGEVVHSPAFPPDQVIDTLGAGDTFNAGVIFALSNGHSVLDAIIQGCKIAGEKVGHHGFKIGSNITN